MRHHHRIRVNGLDGIVAGIGKFYVTGKFASFVCPHKVSRAEEHSAAGFVPHLHPVHGNAGGLQGLQHFLRMCRHVGAHLVDIGFVGLPGGRNLLARRVCEKVTVVEVHHEGQACVRDAPGHSQDIILAAPALVRVYPHAKADGVDAAGPQNRKKIGFLTVLEAELPAFRFHLRSPTDICTLGKGGRTHFFGDLRLSRVRIVLGPARNGRKKCGHKKYPFHGRKLTIFVEDSKKIRAHSEPGHRASAPLGVDVRTKKRHLSAVPMYVHPSKRPGEESVALIYLITSILE